jgi:hypothetical protein
MVLLSGTNPRPTRPVAEGRCAGMLSGPAGHLCENTLDSRRGSGFASIHTFWGFAEADLSHRPINNFGTGGANEPLKGPFEYSGLQIKNPWVSQTFVGWYIILYITFIATEFFFALPEILLGNRYFAIGSDFSPQRLSVVAVRTVIIIIILRALQMTMPQWTGALLPFDKINSNEDGEKQYREYLIYESKHSSATRTLSNRIRTLIAIDSRINVLRSRAGLMLLSIGLLLVASISVIIFAGTLTSLDVSAVNDIDKLDSVINNLESKVVLISNVHDLLAERETATQAQQSDRAQAAQKI